MKPDLSGVRELTPAEIAERRHAREMGGGRRKKKKKRKGRKIRLEQGRNTIVATVSITPELKIRAQRDLGEGSFTKAVISTLLDALLEHDKEEARNR
jgi:hypothetical protein